MYISKYKIISLFIFALALITLSCEENESGVDLIGLEAKFVSEVSARTITFTNVSNRAESYLWDFGDGETSNLISPVHEFDNGSYTVTLSAFDSNGNSATFQESYTINCEATENISPENGNLNWTFLNQNGTAVFDAFGNIGGGVVANPLVEGINTSCNVFQYNKLVGCETWSGAGIVLASALDFSVMTEKIFKLKVLAENQTTEVTMLLEFMPFPNNTPFEQRTATISDTGVWEELTFDFSNLNSGTFENLVIYFERNTPCDGDVYYFDDIIQE